MSDSNSTGLRRKTRGEAASSTTYSEMSESYDQRKKSYVDPPKDKSKLTCLIHGPGHSSDECNVLGDFISKYFRIRPTSDRRHY